MAAARGLTNSPPVEPGDAFGAALGWYAAPAFPASLSLVIGRPGRDRFATDAGAVHPCATSDEGLLCEQHKLQGGGARGAGAATIVYGSQFFEHERLLYQGHGGIGGTPEPGDAFGAAVA